MIKYRQVIEAFQKEMIMDMGFKRGIRLPQP